MSTLTEYLSFVAAWIGLMVLIGVALFITGLFRKKGDNSTVNPEEYAEKFEKELAEKPESKPIKKAFRNPFCLSEDEIEETRRSTGDK